MKLKGLKNIVIVLPERLGDSIFHTPSIALIKKAHPEINIDIIALSPLSAMVVENNPHVRNIYIEPGKEELKRIASGYDAAIPVHPHARSKKQIEIMKIRTLRGTPKTTSRHQSGMAFSAMKNLLDVEALPGEEKYKLYPGKDNHDKISQLLAENDTSAEKDILIGCHIGCHSFTKRRLSFWRPMVHPKVWAFENFVALEAELRKINPRFRLVLTGSKQEEMLGEKFKKVAPKAINLINKTSVLDLAALMESLTIFISSDTGAMHVACASNVGVIALFGPTSLENTGPYPMQPNYRVLQAPAINDIRVEEVLNTIVSHPAVIGHPENKK